MKNRTQQDQEKLQQRRAESQQQQGRTDKSKDVLLAAKDRRIKELEVQNRKLKEELEVAYGKLYENMSNISMADK